MNNYHKIPEEAAGKAREPLVEYGLSSYRREPIAGISDQFMDELLQQTDEVKLVIINRLTYSMRQKLPEKETTVDWDAWKKSKEAKRKDIQEKYHLPDGLTQLLCCVLPLATERWKRQKKLICKKNTAEDETVFRYQCCDGPYGIPYSFCVRCPAHISTGE